MLVELLVVMEEEGVEDEGEGSKSMEGDVYGNWV